MMILLLLLLLLLLLVVVRVLLPLLWNHDTEGLGIGCVEFSQGEIEIEILCSNRIE